MSILEFGDNCSYRHSCLSSLIGLIAENRDAAKAPAIVGVKIRSRVQAGAVIPQHEIARRPGMLVDEFGLFDLDAARGRKRPYFKHGRAILLFGTVRRNDGLKGTAAESVRSGLGCMWRH